MDFFPFELLYQEHQRIIAGAAQSAVTLRLLGALAFELRCPHQTNLRKELGRQLSDLDYMSLTRQWDQVVSLITGLGYSFDERRAMLHGHDRLIFFHPEGLRVDVFFDKLDMCHSLDLRERLDVNDQTLSLADLLLEKLQIVRITEKDIIDMIALFLEYPLSMDEQGINASYISKRLAWDWGFYHTAKTNLLRLRDEFLHSNTQLNEADRGTVHERISALLERIEAAPKTTKWKVRQKIGTSVKWYKDVGDLVR
jgi:hypothetical protein